MTQLRSVILSLAVVAVPYAVGLPFVGASAQETGVSDTAKLQKMTARFAPTEIRADLTRRSAADRQVLAKLVQASKIMDELFLRQVWSGNEAMLLDLAHDRTPAGRARLHYFLVNKGPWSRLDHAQPFVAGAPPKPEGANFYPEGVSKEELENWMKSLADADRAKAQGFFTVVRRGTAGGFVQVPYNVEYQTDLARAAALLREAGALATEPTLKAFLTKRADAFVSNDYYDSDVAWMEIEGSIEPTIGPYEVYEDEFFNYKAAFESFIAVRDEGESAKLQKFGVELQDIEDHLPIDPKYRNPRLGSLAPIVVVNEIFAAGDANHGVQTAAFNLPNDERIVSDRGTKRVMLKNVQDAKFALTLTPISKIVLASGDLKDVSFDAFFTQIVVHELMHGLGPHAITVNGRQTTVRQELKETYSALEEAKADISSLFAMQYLIDKGVLPKSFEKPLYTTFLASTFRSVRFGLNEAHGRGTAVQFNYLFNHGGIISRSDGTFGVNLSKMKEAVTGLTREIMTIEAEGDYNAALTLRDQLGVIRPPVQKALDKLTNVPVDIEPHFTTADELLGDGPSHVGRRPIPGKQGRPS